MELWIRSQNKERLIKVEDLYIEFNGDTNPKIDSHRIVTDKFINLGIYKSKERALEVLDEIHQRLIDLQTLEYLQGTMNLDWKHNRSIDCVYEIPKD